MSKSQYLNDDNCPRPPYDIYEGERENYDDPPVDNAPSTPDPPARAGEKFG